MALGYLQRENLILESYWLVHKEKACVASRKHLKRRSKEKFWKIDSGFYKISCKPPQEMRILPRDTTFYKAALQWQILTCSKEIKRAYSCKSSGYICISIYIWHHQHYAVFRNKCKILISRYRWKTERLTNKKWISL